VKSGSRLVPPPAEGQARAGGRSARVVSEVLRATAEELGRVGYAALRVEDVAQHAHVNKTTIYRRWPTKADLVSATLRQEAEGCEAPPDTGSVREDLLTMLRQFAKHGRTPMVRVLMAEMNHPEVQAIARGLKHNFEEEWVRVIARAMARGELPSSTSPLLVMEVITATIVGRVMKGEEPPDEAFCESVVDLVLAGAVGVGHRRVRAKTA
jgi:AcrR family transcriptional regulator